MKRSLILTGAIALLALPVPASAWWAFNRHEVLPVTQDSFEVISRVGSGPQQFWCGAGDFVYRKMSAPGVTRVYIVAPIGASKTRPGKKAVTFSTTPPEGANTTPGYSLSVKAVGDNLSAASAQQYCYDGGYEDRIFPNF